MTADPRIVHSLKALKASLTRHANTPDENQAAWADSLLDHVEAIEEALADQTSRHSSYKGDA